MLLFTATLAGAQPEQNCPAEVPAESLTTVIEESRPFFLDVREPHEIEELGSLEGYINIPLSELPQRLDELPRDRPILTA